MEPRVNERMSIGRILADCERYWLETRVPRSVSNAMKLELESHLYEAAAAGKSPASVVGEDLAQFAESWASEFRSPAAAEAWRRVQQQQSSTRGRLLSLGLTAAGLITVAVGLATKEKAVDDYTQFWLWLWVGAAVVMGVGEMLTAGFFLLPFAIAAVISMVLALLGVHWIVQLISFIVFSIASLLFLRRFAAKDEDVIHAVGAKRYQDARGTVIETVNPFTGEGRVRVETEVWRATTDLDQIIEVGTPIKVLEVRGSRMVIEQVEV